jgi:ParB/RepB/Spo0J family partition protein
MATKPQNLRYDSKFAVESTKKDEFLIGSDDLVIDSSVRGRKFKPDISGLVASIKEHGQLQPIVIRKDAQKRPVVVCGFSRVDAIKQINSERLIGQPEFKVRCTLITASDGVESFKRTLAENVARNQLSPVDMAFAVAELQNKYMQTRKEIASVFNRTESWVMQMERLCSLSDDLHKQIHAGVISVEAALHISPETPEFIAEVIEEVVAEKKAVGKTKHDKPKKEGKKNHATVTLSDVKKKTKEKSSPSSGLVKPISPVEKIERAYGLSLGVGKGLAPYRPSTIAVINTVRYFIHEDQDITEFLEELGNIRELSEITLSEEYGGTLPVQDNPFEMEEVA